jgi:flavin reductase (DIM6/NTAB) family NADH-FMN oxidoreductase RutF
MLITPLAWNKKSSRGAARSANCSVRRQARTLNGGRDLETHALFLSARFRVLAQWMVSGMTGVQVTGGAPADLQQHFQDAFGRVAATVGIIGVCDEHGDVYGMTATAISSLSNDPPSLIVLLNHENQTFRTICERKRFSVSFLSAGSEGLAYKLSRPGQNKLIDAAHLDQPAGWPMPAVRNATATLVCDLDDCIPQFTHRILVGRITHVRTSEGPANPLLYLQRKFQRLTA